MASDEHNALAELASDLSWIEAILCSAGYAEYSEDANKAQRIITELAKVRFNRHEVFGEYANGDDLIKAMNNCRAIAEEGVNHEN